MDTTRLFRRDWTRGPLLNLPLLMAISIAMGCAADQDKNPSPPFSNMNTAVQYPPPQNAASLPIQQVAYTAPVGATNPSSPGAPVAGPKTAVEQVLPPVGECSMTLDQAIAETLQSDPKLRGALEAIRQAEGDFITSSLPPNPTVQINGVFLPLRTFTPARPGGPPELDVIATYPIDWWLFGKRAAEMVNADQAVAVSHSDYADQVRQRLANTAAAFFDVLEAKAMLKLSQEDLAGLERVERITASGVRLGGSGTIDAERVRLSVLDARRDLRTREATLTTNKAQFHAAIGRRMTAVDFDANGNLEVPRAAAPIPVADAVRIAEQNRPDIISLRRQIDKARSAIAVENTKARPTVAPSLGYQDQFQESNGVADASSWTAQLNVSVPLFDRNQGNIAKAESVLSQSYFNLQAQLSQTEADIEQAVAEFQAARNDVISIGPEQVQLARSVRDRTEEAYRLGGKTLLEVLDAEKAYRDAYRTYILSQSGYWHALYRLNAALGRQVL